MAGHPDTDSLFSWSQEVSGKDVITATGRNRYHPYVKTPEVDTIRSISNDWGVKDSMVGAQAVRYWLARLYTKGNWELMLKYHQETYQKGRGENLYFDLSLVEVSQVDWIVKALKSRGGDLATFNECSLVGTAVQQFKAYIKKPIEQGAGPEIWTKPDLSRALPLAKTPRDIQRLATMIRSKDEVPWVKRQDLLMTCEACGAQMQLHETFDATACLLAEFGFRRMHAQSCKPAEAPTPIKKAR